jgi:DNA-binding CsgD family transcriptional regulator
MAALEGGRESLHELLDDRIPKTSPNNVYSTADMASENQRKPETGRTRTAPPPEGAGARKTRKPWRRPAEPEAQRRQARWMKEEDRILARNYKRHGSKSTAALLGRSMTAVQSRARVLGLPGKNLRPWTAIERKYLQRSYADHTARQIARTLRRTEESVRGQINKMGLATQESRPWSRKEIADLRKLYGSRSSAELAEHFGRTIDAVELKAGRIGLSRRIVAFAPSARDKAFIIENLGRIPYTQLAAKFGTTVHNITRIAEENGYRDRPTSRPWTEEDDTMLRSLYGTMTRADVARQLDRTPVATAERARRLGLTQPSKRASTVHKWTPKEDALLRRLYGTMTCEEIARRIGRSTIAIYGRVRILGLRSN